MDGRADAPVESAAYFAVSEVLTNAVKHSAPSASGSTSSTGTERSASPSPTTERAAPGSARARASPASSGGSVHSTASWPSAAPRAVPPWSPWRSLARCPHRRPVPAARRTGPDARGVRLRDRRRRRERARTRPGAGRVGAGRRRGRQYRLPPSHTDEGLQCALQARRERPGLPVLVLSSTWSSCTHGSCSRTARAGSVICSRTGCSTRSSSWTSRTAGRRGRDRDGSAGHSAVAGAAFAHRAAPWAADTT